MLTAQNPRQIAGVFAFDEHVSSNDEKPVGAWGPSASSDDPGVGIARRALRASRSSGETCGVLLRVTVY